MLKEATVFHHDFNAWKSHAQKLGHSVEPHPTDSRITVAKAPNKKKYQGAFNKESNIGSLRETTNCMGMSSSIQGTGHIATIDTHLTQKLLKRIKLKGFRSVTK